ncbi:hypothetical protein FHK92_02830 [Pseudomonas brassicacearum subsp. neoaurantiaca]|uniref:Uncharacterized protein n=1 Tax=Pseudomonas brassicacearum subsp. neoaurantiaca TaxID=494916 RepID=A0A7V8UAT3_9PSED|nr:hypothetical protein [Pseudomonas brassicacearum subsp. neoaurantiaca]
MSSRSFLIVFAVMDRHECMAEPVGASLLAMASAQPASMLTDTPLSRASSLPQGIVLHPGPSAWS